MNPDPPNTLNTVIVKSLIEIAEKHNLIKTRPTLIKENFKESRWFNDNCAHWKHQSYLSLNQFNNQPTDENKIQYLNDKKAYKQARKKLKHNITLSGSVTCLTRHQNSFGSSYKYQNIEILPQIKLKKKTGNTGSKHIKSKKHVRH